jgi:iron complex transport system substrate-binding protein
LLKELGVRNAAEQLGIGRLGQTSIESALKAQTDGLILFDPASRATDQGSAILLHPALNDIYPPSRRLAIPGRLVVCAGPALPMAIAELEVQLRNLRPRRETSK